MGIKLAGQSVRITDLIGHLVGLIYLGNDQEVTTDFGTRSVPRARVVDLDEGVNRGTTLIYQAGIGNEIKAQAGSWVVGTLTEGPHPKNPEWTLYTLDTDGVDMEKVLEAFETAGVDPEAKV